MREGVVGRFIKHGLSQSNFPELAKYINLQQTHVVDAHSLAKIWVSKFLNPVHNCDCSQYLYHDFCENFK
jgi:hypothetical protein